MFLTRLWSKNSTVFSRKLVNFEKTFYMRSSILLESKNWDQYFDDIIIKAE